MDGVRLGPAEQTAFFPGLQAVKDNRSPMYDRIFEVQDELVEMRKMIKELSEKVEKFWEKSQDEH
ncbi:hypothetical protein [Methanosarcina siciliae]|uniref:hypothetical protein n=1 Tax=Methanosarcina siciliae TaxID=38027 RepID=UPI0021C32C8D|nr:hypothetical protein [Methanosarcina siciliae]